MHLQEIKYTVLHREKKHPVSLNFMMDKQWEELAFPVLFPKGTYMVTLQKERLS